MPEVDPAVFQSLYDESPEPVFVFRPAWDHGRVVDFHYVYVNAPAAKVIGRTREEKVGQSLRASAPDAERSGMLARYQRTAETGQPTQEVIRYDDGRLTGWFRIIASRAGEFLLVNFRDVTAEKQAEQALRTAEAERSRTEDRRSALEALVMHVPAQVAYVRGPELVYEFANARYRANHGHKELVGRKLTEMLPQWAEDPLIARMRDVLRTGEAFTAPEYPVLIETNGRLERRWFNVAYLPVHGADGAVEGVISFSTEVTELVAARTRSDALARDKMALAEELETERKSLQTSEERFRSIVETHADIVWVCDWAGRFRIPVQAWTDFTGQSPEQMLGMGWIDSVHPDDLARTGETWMRSIAEKQRFECEYRLRRADGSYANVVSRGIPLLRPDGRIREWVGTTTDVSIRRREEMALRLLSGGAARLGGTLDYDASIRAIAEMAVPELADVCIVDLFGPDGALRRVDVAGTLPAEVLETLRRVGPHVAPGGPASRAVEEGRAVLLDDVPREPPPGALDPEREALFHQVGPSSVIAAPLVAPGGRTLGVLTFLTVRRNRRFDALDVGIVEELARRSALALDNAELFRRAEEANRAKDEFLATVSHELRTPLAAILGWTRLLRGGGLSPEKQLRALDTLERNARAQTRLVEDLLDVSRIVTGKTRLSVESIDLGRVTELALDSVRPTAEARGVRLESQLRPCPMWGDPERLQQVVWNLLSNAIKFTPRGGRVDVRLRVQDGVAELCVADTGQGIRPDFLDHVFERFRQADATATRQHGGLGLGLAIVRHLVELHGGTAGAASPGEGRGSTFTVRLPLALSRGAAGSAQGAAALEAAELVGLRVLVVDDEADTRDFVVTLLEARSAQVVSAADAEEALALVSSARPDVIVSDLAMPRTDGCALLREIRRSDDVGVRDTPAIALSAFARPEDRARALEAGFQAYLTKPVEPETLGAAVAALARSRAAA